MKRRPKRPTWTRAASREQEKEKPNHRGSIGADYDQNEQTYPYDGDRNRERGDQGNFDGAMNQ